MTTVCRARGPGPAAGRRHGGAGEEENTYGGYAASPLPLPVVAAGRRLSWPSVSSRVVARRKLSPPFAAMSAPADFSAQQFAKDSVAEKVLEQYDDEKTRLFYQITMGGGGHDIHYGIFRSPSDGVRESSKHSTDFMMSCMDWARPARE